MPFDVQRYNRLIASTAADFSFYTGSIQDRSSAQRTMTLVGGPSWTPVNGLPCFSQRANADGIATTGVVPRVLDLTGSIFFEIVLRPTVEAAANYLVYQVDGTTTGLAVFYQPNAGNRDVRIYLYNAAAVARRVIGPAASAPVGALRHHLIGSVAGGTSGLVWTNGIPGTPILLGAGAAANIAAPTQLTAAGSGGTGRQDSLIIRAWQGVPVHEDAQCLYQAARSLTGGEV
jgi:hypothetical protein